MNWDTRRKLLYASSVFVIIVASSIFFLRGVIFPAPTCVDNKQNGYEVGVDCGGQCALRCSQEVSPLTVLWSKAIRSGKGVYDIVGMVNNNNIDNASYETGYTFTMHGAQGQIIGTISGSTTAPLGGKFPIIIQNFPLQEVPVSVLLTLSDTQHYKVQESQTSPTVKIITSRYEPGDIPRVYAMIMNTKRINISNLPVRALLFDENDNVYAVGQTIVPSLEKEEIKELVFTWNQPLAFPPTRTLLYPIFNPFEAIGY